MKKRTLPLAGFAIALSIAGSTLSASAGVVAVGRNAEGQSAVPADLANASVTAVSAGNKHSVALLIYITDGKTVAPGSAYAVGTRLLHKLDLLSIDANGSANSTIFTMDGFLQEPRGIEIIPTDPLTGN